MLPMAAKQILLLCPLLLIKTLLLPNAHMGDDSESSLTLPNAPAIILI